MRFVLFCLTFLFLSAVPAGSLINSPSAPTVVIDVGHGGPDRGAKAGQPYCEEKRIALLTARLAKQYLEQLGYHVVMTRSTDNFISLPRRVEIAKQANANIFVSVHYNSSRSPEAKGIEVFFFDSKENKSRATASKKLADAILSKVIRKTAANSRGVKKGNFYVIRETSMPAVLVEGGFISNAKERTLLKSRLYQEKIAQGIADGVDQYFKARWRRASAMRPRAGVPLEAGCPSLGADSHPAWCSFQSRTRAKQFALSWTHCIRPRRELNPRPVA